MRRKEPVITGSHKANLFEDPTRGEAGMLPTVLETSAEGGDCGEVGRGNRMNGVMCIKRPGSAEAAVGRIP